MNYLVRRFRRPVSVAIAVAVLCAFPVASTSPAAAANEAEETALVNLTNQARNLYGLGSLQYDPLASNIARNWSYVMASDGWLRHNPNLAAQISASVTSEWTRIGENVAGSSSITAIHNLFMASTPHRNNILGDFNRLGVGVIQDGGGVFWVTVVFIKGPPIPPSSPPTAPVYPFKWLLRNTNDQGAPQYYYAYGPSTTRTLSCDWDGDGEETPAFVDGNVWAIRNSNTPGYPEIVLVYGMPHWTPVCGDWNGDGKDTIGAVDGNIWALRNSNTAGYPEIVFPYGMPSWTKVVGDWNGDGKDTPGAVDGNIWALRNSNTPGYPEIVFPYGMHHWKKMVGDWNGDGKDTPGAVDINIWALRNSNTAGYPEIVFPYAMPNWIPVAGDWNGDGKDTAGAIGI